MNIALIGYGKMGQVIERIAVERGHSIVLKIRSNNKQDLMPENLARADVAIEFTSPEAAPENVALCLASGVPVVCGTTGWNDQLDSIRGLAQEANAGFLYASNFSIGVNIFFEINKLLAQLMSTQHNYTPSIEEVHHLLKKDKPSGTAITLAEQLISESEILTEWTLANEDGPATALPIDAVREDSVPGTHKISWQSSVDGIEIIHTAHNRDGFALGAILAAEFLRGKRGSFTMKDVLSI